MTELGSPRDTGRTKKVAAKSGNPVSRFFASIGLFIRQILDELRKVVRPTRSELGNYTPVVIVFVTFMMAMVSGLDFGFSKRVGLVFGT